MKIFKLALLFILCVVVLVVALYVPRLFKSDKSIELSNSTVESVTSVVQNEDANMLLEEYMSEEKVAATEPIENSEKQKEESIETSATSKSCKIIHEDKETQLSKEEALARHMEQKKELENRLVSLLNSGKYQDGEDACKREWSLNKYYVDVKYIRKILSSRDTYIYKGLMSEGVIDTNGILTEKYKLKNTKEIATLKSKLEKY